MNSELKIVYDTSTKTIDELIEELRELLQNHESMKEVFSWLRILNEHLDKDN